MSDKHTYKFYSDRLSDIRTQIRGIESHYRTCNEPLCNLVSRYQLSKLYVEKIRTWNRLCELVDTLDINVLLKHINA